MRGNDGEMRFQLKLEVVEDRLIEYTVAIMEQQLSVVDEGLRIPECLQGFGIPPGETAVVQARMDTLAAKIVRLKIPGFSWENKGFRAGCGTLEFLERIIGDYEEFAGRCEGTMIDVEGRVLPEQRRLS